MKNDKNNEFYYSLINKITAISPVPLKTDTYLKGFIAYFHSIAKNASYAQYFAELGYWSENRINQNEIISLYHHESELKILALYLKESDLAIAIALDTPNIELSLDDPRIKNLVEKILTL